MVSAVPFDRETLLDLVVNAIPLGIMLFFIAVFLLVNPFGSDPVGTAIQISIVGVTFVALFILTYVSGKAISESERELEEKGYAPVSESVGADDGIESDGSDGAVAGELGSGTPTEPDAEAAADGESTDPETDRAEA